MKLALAITSALSLVLVCFVGFQWMRPALATERWSADYKELMHQCDNAMREHYIAKKAVEFTPSETTVATLQATELSLMACHDYDKLRKQMISWGLDSDALALIGLEAIEEKAYELDHFVQIHEFRYQ